MANLIARDLIQRLLTALELSQELSQELSADSDLSLSPEKEAEKEALILEARGYLGADPASLSELAETNRMPSDIDIMQALKGAIAEFPPTHPEAREMSSKRYGMTLELRKAYKVISLLDAQQQGTR